MSDFPKDAPSIRDAKPRKKTNVKYDKDMNVMAPTIDHYVVEANIRRREKRLTAAAA